MPQGFTFKKHFLGFQKWIPANDKPFSPAFSEELRYFYSPNGKMSQLEGILRTHFAQECCESKEIMDLAATNAYFLHFHKKLFP